MGDFRGLVHAQVLCAVRLGTEEGRLRSCLQWQRPQQHRLGLRYEVVCSHVSAAPHTRTRGGLGRSSSRCSVLGPRCTAPIHKDRSHGCVHYKHVHGDIAPQRPPDARGYSSTEQSLPTTVAVTKCWSGQNFCRTAVYSKGWQGPDSCFEAIVRLIEI